MTITISRPINRKNRCKRCCGSGFLLRPTTQKILTFKKCTNCGSHGVRFIIDEIPPK